MKKTLVVIIALLVLGGAIFAFLHTLSPEPTRIPVNRIPPHARNIRKGTTVKAKKRRPRPIRRDPPSETGVQNKNKEKL